MQCIFFLLYQNVRNKNKEINTFKPRHANFDKPNQSKTHIVLLGVSNTEQQNSKQTNKQTMHAHHTKQNAIKQNQGATNHAVQHENKTKDIRKSIGQRGGGPGETHEAPIQP